MEITVATYNVRHCADVGFDASIIAKDIADINADIAGLQEIDVFTARSNINTPEILTSSSPYNCIFSKSIDYQGGEYGHAIMSKLNILSHQTILLDSFGHEQRVLSSNVIDLNGTAVRFINTHLSYDVKHARERQIQQLIELTSDSMPYIITGDFNTDDKAELMPLVMHGATLVNCFDREYKSFIPTQTAIDNIAFSKHFTLVESGMSNDIHSDHKMIWAKLQFEN